MGQSLTGGSLKRASSSVEVTMALSQRLDSGKPSSGLLASDPTSFLLSL